MQKDPNTSRLQSKKNKKKIKALCFSPRKHKSNVERKAESGTPCKLTKFSVHATEENVIWVNAATQINDALEVKVDFCCDTHYNETPMVTTKDLDDIQVYQTVTVRGNNNNNNNKFISLTLLIKVHQVNKIK